MKAVVIYCSQTGNTKKVAEAIAEVLGTKAKSVGEKIDLRNCDLICVGTGVHATRPEGGMTSFLKGLEKLEGRKGAVFGTYWILTGFLNTLESLLKERGVDVIGKWGCKGQFGRFNRGRPNEKDLEDAREFAKTLKSKLS
jgi:flavodoxin